MDLHTTLMEKNSQNGLNSLITTQGRDLFDL